MDSSYGKGWLFDFNVRVDRDAVTRLVDRSEEQALYRSGRALRPYWLLLMASVGGLLGGPIASRALWTAPEWGALCVAGLAVVVTAVGSLSGALFGNVMRRRTIIAMLTGAAIAAAGQVGAQLGTWLFAAAGGAAIGFAHGRLASQSARNNLLWLPANMLFGAAAACFGVYLVSAGPAAAMLPLVAAGGGTSAIAFYVLILSFFAHYYSAAGGLRDLAQIYIHCDETLPTAVAHLTEAIRLSPHDPDLFILRGVAYSFAGELEMSRADYQRVESMLPTHIEPAMNHALDLARRDEFDESIAILRRLTDRAPNDPLVVCNLGAILSRRGDFAESVECFDKAIALRPDYPRAFSNRAYSKAKLGWFDDALRDAEQALTQNPRSAMAYAHRGMAHAGLGAVDKAVEDYRTAIRIGGELDADEQARKGLEELGLQA